MHASSVEETDRRLRENLAAVRERMTAAALRAGRSLADVRLVGVTKYVSASTARQLIKAGLSCLGESRPQEIWQKAADLAGMPIEWHLIGHLQRNKVRRTLPLVTLIHSIDNLRLAAEISREAESLNRRVAVLLEVNVSGEAAKHGFAASTVEAALPLLAALPGIQVQGLMGMAALEGGLAAARRNFAALRELAEFLRPQSPPGIELHDLSMGMSDDFEIAIEEGATIVRVGSALFEGLAADES
jgi:pyridoxal phosphate enzyme (YggS family)